MGTTFTRPWIFILIAVLAAAWSSADVIYGEPDPAGFPAGVSSDTSGPSLVVCAFALDAGATTITDVHWWGAYSRGDGLGTDDFTLAIFGDAGGVPQSAPLWTFDAGSVPYLDTLQPFDSTNFRRYDLDIAPLTLAAGATYYFSVVNDTAADSDDWFWALYRGPSPVPYFLRYSESDPWQDLGYLPYYPAFYLTGPSVVPEPTSIVLLGLGTAAFAFRRGRRR